MGDTPKSGNWLDIAVGQALLSSAIRKVPKDDRKEVVHAAIVEAEVNRSKYDETKGSVESWFHGILENVVKTYFKKRKKMIQLPQAVEDEAASCDPGMDEVDCCDFEAWIAKLGVETLRDSPPKVRQAVTMLAEGKTVDQIADLLDCEVHAVTERISRFGREFKRRFESNRPPGETGGYGNRVNVVVIIESIHKRTIQVDTKNMFVTGSVSNGIFGSDNSGNAVGSTINVHFGQFADGVARLAEAVSVEKSVPANVKARAIECLGDIEDEARSTKPSMESIKGMIQFLAQIAPSVVAIAKTMGVPFFG